MFVAPRAPPVARSMPGIAQRKLCAVESSRKPERLRGEQRRAQGKKQHGRSWDERKQHAYRQHRDRHSQVGELDPTRPVLLGNMKFLEAFAGELAPGTSSWLPQV